jgi:hypothetical protein
MPVKEREIRSPERAFKVLFERVKLAVVVHPKPFKPQVTL